MNVYRINFNNKITKAYIKVDTNTPLAENNLFDHIKMKNNSKLGITHKLNTFVKTSCATRKLIISPSENRSWLYK